MSTTSRIIPKGEKGKSKFQSLDINNLYQGQDSEPTQIKGTLFRTKNGMQSLGKVPTARRPPINLPSLKAENSGNEPAVSLVPPGAAGWGSKPGECPPSSQPNVPATSSGPVAPAPAPVAVVTQVVMQPPAQHEAAMRAMMPHGGDKTWSAIMAGEQNNFLVHQSYQFQQEFPKLAQEGGVAGQQGKAPDAQYGPGPSLRPQTEGSWISGGGRVQGGVGGAPVPQSLGPAPPIPLGPDPGAPRTNLGPHPAPGVAMGPGGPNFPHANNYRPLHPFNELVQMFPTRPGGSFPGNMPGMPPRSGPMPASDNRPPPRQPQDNAVEVPRPIIRDEELNKLDEIALDDGWAHDQNIDYNQQLAFSDNEDEPSRRDKRERGGRGKDMDKGDRRSEESMKRSNAAWNRGPAPRADEGRNVRNVIQAATERSKQLKDEESKKAGGGKRKDDDDAAVLYPDFGDKERTRSGSEGQDDKGRQGSRTSGGRNNQRDRDDRDAKRDVVDREPKYDRERERDRDRRDEREGKREERDRDGKRDDRREDRDRDGKRDDRRDERDREGKRDDRREDRDTKRDDRDRRDFGRSGPRSNDSPRFIPPRLRAKQMMRSTGSPQPAGTAVNNMEPIWGHAGRRYPGENEAPPPADSRDADWYPKNNRHPSYSEQNDHRRYYDKKERDEEADRGSDDRDYKKPSREPPPRKEDRKESSEEREREPWRAGEHGQPPRPESRDSRESDFRAPRPDSRDPNRPDSRDVEIRNVEHNDNRNTSQREAEVRNHPPRPDSRDVEPRRPESRDVEVRGPQQRPDNRDEGRNYPHRPDSHRQESRGEHQRQEPRQHTRDDRAHGTRPESRDSDKDRKEERRPPRPDSRDSRTSRDSRNSREDKHDSDDKTSGRGRFGNSQFKEEVERKEPSGRHPPGPITREKLEACERAAERKPVKSPGPPATDVERQEVSQQSSATSLPQNGKQNLKGEKEDIVVLGKGGKLRPARDRWGGSSTYISNGLRRRRATDRTTSRITERSNGRGGNETESGSSCEGSSELGKGEKEERNRETRREGFAPSGQPSRRGRGAARVRGGGATSGRIDNYGPPPAKPPFPHPDPPAPEEEEDRTKQKQAALNAGIAGTAARIAASAAAASNTNSNVSPPQRNETRPAPRQQRQPQSNRDKEPQRPRVRDRDRDRDFNRNKPNRNGSKRGTGDGDENWDTLSASDGEDKKDEKRPDNRGQRFQGNKGPPLRNQQPRPNQGAGTGGSRPSDNKEEKFADNNKAGKPAEGDADSTLLLSDRKKGGKENYRSGPKSDSSRGSGSERGGKDKRNKTAPPIIPPTNPSGPQPLMSQVVNPPMSLKNTWRNQTPLPPRLQKQQQQQHHQQQQQSNDAHDLNKISGSTLFSSKAENISGGISSWEKSLGTASTMPAEQSVPDTNNARSSPATKITRDQLLDETAPPVTTIIFENTNLKSGGAAHAKFAPPKQVVPPAPSPQHQQHSPQQPPPHRVEKGVERKPGEEPVLSPFAKADLSADSLTESSIKLQLYRDQNLSIDFPFNTGISEMTEEKTNNFSYKLAATKKLWEPTGVDQGEEDVPGSAVFPGGFCQDPSMESVAFSKGVDVAPDDYPTEVVYSPGAQMPVTGSFGVMGKSDVTASSNVCKVKPQQQAPLGHAGQTSLSSPPFTSSQPSQFTYQQTSLGGSAAQFGGMPASPPAVMSYSSQQLQPNQNLFPAYQLETARAANQFSQYSAPYGISGGLGGSSTFSQLSQPSLYLQHPAAAPPPNADIYNPSMSQYRIQQHPSAQFGQSQLNSNQNQTVLLTSSSNSLMSASVKPSSQNIGAIGTKGTAFQQSSQQYIINYDGAIPLNINQNYLASSGLMQRGGPVPPAGPNFYNSSPSPQTGFYGNPGSTLPQQGPTAPLHQGAGYGLQSYGTQSSNLNFSSQMGIPFRNTLPTQFLKSGVSNNASSPDVIASVFNSGGQQIPSPKSRPIKQPMNHPPPQQSPTQLQTSKFSPYSTANQLVMQQQVAANHQRSQQPTNMGMGSGRGGYPTPIQRPLNRYGRPHHPRGPPSEGNMKLEDGNDLSKVDDSSQMNCEPKLVESAAPSKGDGPEEDAVNNGKE